MKIWKRKIPKKVLEETKRRIESAEQGIPLKEFLRRLKKLREKEEKEPSQRKPKKKPLKKK